MQYVNVENNYLIELKPIEEENFNDDFAVVFDGKSDNPFAGGCKGCGGKFFFAVNVATS